jgi:hypothetical protein
MPRDGRPLLREVTIPANCNSPIEQAQSDGQSSSPIAGAATHKHQGWVDVHDEACYLKRLMSSQAQFVAAWIVIFIIAVLAYWVYLQTAPMD